MGRDYIFSKRRRIFAPSLLFGLALVIVFGFGMWMISPDKNETDIAEPVEYKNDTEKQSAKDNVVLSDFEAYYLLKEDEGFVKLLYYDESGEELLIRVTDIPFPLISPADQAGFTEGIVIHDEDELDAILQDFES